MKSAHYKIQRITKKNLNLDSSTLKKCLTNTNQLPQQYINSITKFNDVHMQNYIYDLNKNQPATYLNNQQKLMLEKFANHNVFQKINQLVSSETITARCKMQLQEQLNKVEKEINKDKYNDIKLNASCILKIRQNQFVKLSQQFEAEKENRIKKLFDFAQQNYYKEIDEFLYQQLISQYKSLEKFFVSKAEFNSFLTGKLEHNPLQIQAWELLLKISPKYEQFGQINLIKIIKKGLSNLEDIFLKSQLNVEEEKFVKRRLNLAYNILDQQSLSKKLNKIEQTIDFFSNIKKKFELQEFQYEKFQIPIQYFKDPYKMIKHQIEKIKQSFKLNDHSEFEQKFDEKIESLLCKVEKLKSLDVLNECNYLYTTKKISSVMIKNMNSNIENFPKTLSNLTDNEFNIIAKFIKDYQTTFYYIWEQKQQLFFQYDNCRQTYNKFLLKIQGFTEYLCQILDQLKSNQMNLVQFTKNQQKQIKRIYLINNQKSDQFLELLTQRQILFKIKVAFQFLLSSLKPQNFNKSYFEKCFFSINKILYYLINRQDNINIQKPFINKKKISLVQNSVPQQNQSIYKIKKHIGQNKFIPIVDKNQFQFNCSDLRQEIPILGSLGGDFAQFLYILRSFELAFNDKLDYAQIKTLFENFLTFNNNNKNKPFFFHTSIDEVRNLIKQMGENLFQDEELIDFYKNPPMEIKQALLAEILKFQNQGCLHVRLIMKDPLQCNIRQQLIENFMSIFYNMLWQNDERIQLLIINNKYSKGIANGCGIAVINCQNENFQPKIRPSLARIKGKRSEMFVIHPFATNQVRQFMCNYIISQAQIFGKQNQLYNQQDISNQIFSNLLKISEKAEDNIKHVLIPRLPIYEVYFDIQI